MIHTSICRNLGDAFRIGDKWYKDGLLSSSDMGITQRYNLVNYNREITEYLSDYFDQSIVIYINNLFYGESDVAGLQATDIITEFLLHTTGVIGIILYGDQQLIEKLGSLRPNFMSLFFSDFSDIKEPEEY